jgi:NitT/TauT family transport system permease protein
VGALIAALTAYALYHIVRYVGTEVTSAKSGMSGAGPRLPCCGWWADPIASLIWVPLGVMIGLRPSLAEKSSHWHSSSPRSRPTCCFRCLSL